MKVSAVILAGGKGHRMGGQDKGLMLCAGKPLIAYVIARLEPQVDEILINANRELDQYEKLGFPVIKDATNDFAGPLAGFQVAMQQAQHDYVLSVPCDSPLLPSDLYYRLSQALNAQKADIAVAWANGQSQPVFSLFRKSLLPQLDQYLAEGNRKVDRWQKSLKLVEVSFEDNPIGFININTPEELAGLEKAL